MQGSVTRKATHCSTLFASAPERHEGIACSMLLMKVWGAAERAVSTT